MHGVHGMLNPLKIFEYDPLDRTKLNWFTKIVAWFIEYIARIIGAVYLSIALLLVSVWPKRSATKTFFRIIGTVADMYRMKWMSGGEENRNNDTEGLDKGDGQKVRGLESYK